MFIFKNLFHSVTIKINQLYIKTKNEQIILEKFKLNIINEFSSFFKILLLNNKTIHQSVSIILRDDEYTLKNEVNPLHKKYC